MGKAKFRILIVEDIDTTREQLGKLIQEDIMDVRLDCADTLAAGVDLIQRTAAEGASYDVAILDFYLPSASGESLTVNDSLCEALAQHMRDALVIHITAYSNDPQVLEHLRDYDLSGRGPRAIVVKKTNVQWPDELMARLREHLYGSVIGTRLDELFGGESASGRDVRPYSGGTGRADATHVLAELATEVREHWDDLNEDLHNRVRKYLCVDETTKPVRVTLF